MICIRAGIAGSQRAYMTTSRLALSPTPRLATMGANIKWAVSRPMVANPETIVRYNHLQIARACRYRPIPKLVKLYKRPPPSHPFERK